MTITAAAQPADTPPRVALNLASITGTEATILRVDPDGRSRPVRSAEPAALTSGAWIGWDYEAPFGAPISYTVVPTTGATQSTAQLTLDVPDIWLIHASLPDLSMRLDTQQVTALAPRARSPRSAVLTPLGRSTPVVVSDVRASASAGIELFTDTYDQRDELWALLDDGTPILVNIPPGLGWGITAEWAAVEEVTETPIVGNSTVRTFTLPYAVVDRPVGALTATWTWAGVIAAYPTWGDALAAYDTYADVLANTP
jgi:hypothetical protein